MSNYIALEPFSSDIAGAGGIGPWRDWTCWVPGQHPGLTPEPEPPDQTVTLAEPSPAEPAQYLAPVASRR